MQRLRRVSNPIAGLAATVLMGVVIAATGGAASRYHDDLQLLLPVVRFWVTLPGDPPGRNDGG